MKSLHCGHRVQLPQRQPQHRGLGWARGPRARPRARPCAAPAAKEGANVALEERRGSEQGASTSNGPPANPPVLIGTTQPSFLGGSGDLLACTFLVGVGEGC